MQAMMNISKLQLAMGVQAAWLHFERNTCCHVMVKTRRAAMLIIALDSWVLTAPTSSAISTLAPSMVPMMRPPFMQNFMLDVPEASVPAVLMCCDSSDAAGPQKRQGSRTPSVMLVYQCKVPSTLHAGLLTSGPSSLLTYQDHCPPHVMLIVST